MQKRRSVDDGQHSRRAFVARMASATAGMLVGGGLGQAGWRALQAQGAPGPRRREVSIDGRRVTVVDIHAHTFVPEVWDLVKKSAPVFGAQFVGLQLVKDKSDVLVQIYKEEVATSQHRAPKGWSLLLKGEGSDLLAVRSADLAKRVLAIPPGDQATFQIISQLLLKKTQLEVNLLRQMQLRNALQAWLYIHVPVSIAMVFAVGLHLIVVFLY